MPVRPLVVAAALLTAAVWAVPAHAAPLPSPCHPGTAVMTFAPLGRPHAGKQVVACGSSTGYGAVETRIGASPAGVVFDPAESNGVEGAAYSVDRGTTWTATQAGGGIDGNAHADPRTGRIFRLTFGAGSSNPQNHRVTFTDDGGRTWTESATGACCVDGENSRIITGAPRTSTTTGYPDVVYLCSDTSLLGGVAYPTGGRVCSKSLDGGRTFQLAGVLFTKPVPTRPECAPYGGEYFAASEGAYPESAPDGTLYVLVHCGTPDHVVATFLGVSRDEAATWQLQTCGGTSAALVPNAAELRVDDAGNLYVGVVQSTTLADGRQYDDTPMLQVSTDHGCGWSAPMRVAPVGVAAHSHHPEDNAFQTGQKAPVWPQPFSDYSWDMDAREPGHVAFAFYGSDDPTGHHWDAWITESFNATKPSPTFVGATVNDPAVTNFHDGAYADEFSSGNEHLGLSLSSDGTPWASFTDGTNGFAGYLLRS